MVLFRSSSIITALTSTSKTSGSIPGIPFKTKINPGISTEIKHFMNFKTDLNFRKRL
jgi:hypothetical protein